MILIVGGSCQGKLTYALGLAEREFTPLDMADGRDCGLMEGMEKPVLHHFHALVRRWMEAGEDTQALTDRICGENPDILLISDDVGSGIVPLDPFERQWREATGRLCCKLAKEAKQVHRVVCGIGTRLL